MGELPARALHASSAVALPGETVPRGTPNLPRHDETSRNRLRVVKPTERRHSRGPFNRYAPWGTMPFIVLFDVTALALAAMLIAAPLVPTLVLIALTLAVFHTRGLYRPSLSHSVLNWAPDLAVATGAVVGMGSLVWLSVTSSTTTSAGSILAAAFLAIVFVTIGRTISAGLVRFARSRRMVSHNVVVLGAGAVGADLVRTMREQPKYGLMPVGYYDPSPLGDVDMPTFDLTQDIMTVIERLDAAAVIVAFSSMSDSTLVPIIRACDRMACEIFVVPRLFELLPVDHNQSDTIGTTNLVRLRRASHRSGSWRLKRIFDVVASAGGLVVLSPLLLVGFLGSLKENGWPVLFRQERVGLDGRRFDILKFQTMRPVDENESETNWNIGEDDRVGPISRFLRVSSIDELPQLWNVLRGDMSLVGPRPERPHFVGQFSEEIETYSFRHRVPSGLTGFAQVEGLRGDTSITERARYDNAYVESWSLWTDIKILLRSVVSVVTRRGA